MIRLAALVATIVLAVLPGPVMAQAGRGAAVVEPMAVLERFPLAPGRVNFLVLVGRPQASRAVELRLEAARDLVARHDTGWRVAGGPATRADREADREIRDGARTRAWTFGAEADESLLAARPLRFAGVDALLLLHRAGFEHVKREFMIVGARGNTLRRLWQGGDGAGPFVSWIDLQPGGDQPIFFRALVHPEPDQLDTMRVRQLAWNGRSVAERPARGLWAVVGGGYPDAAAARAARERAPQTGGNFWVLAPAMLLRRPEGRVALIALTSSEARARELLAEARRSGFPQAILTRANPG
jgi:hypothetical protein